MMMDDEVFDDAELERNARVVKRELRALYRRYKLRRALNKVRDTMKRIQFAMKCCFENK